MNNTATPSTSPKPLTEEEYHAEQSRRIWNASFRVPPVHTGAWEASDWQRWRESQVLLPHTYALYLEHFALDLTDPCDEDQERCPRCKAASDPAGRIGYDIQTWECPNCGQFDENGSLYDAAQ